MKNVGGGGSTQEDDVLTIDVQEDQIKDEVLDNFFKDGDADDEGIFLDHSVSTATRNKNTVTAYQTLN